MEADSNNRPNWLYFTGVFLAVQLVAFAISLVVVLAFDLDPPAVIGLLVFYLAAHYAGKNYATSTGFGWTRDERHRLAIGYSAIALVLATILSIPFAVLPALGGGQLPLADPIFLVILAVMLPLGALLQYAIARFVFGEIMKRASKAGASQ